MRQPSLSFCFQKEKCFCTCGVILEQLSLRKIEAEVKPVRGHTWKENLASRLKGGAINWATCPAELLQRGNGEKVSSDSGKLSKMFCTQATTEVINSSYNVTTYHTLSHWPWDYYSHLNIIVVLNWEWNLFRKFVWGLKKKTTQLVKKIPLELVREAVSVGCSLFLR